MKKIFLPFMAILLFASCHKENERISICHTDPKTGTSKVISISLGEWPAHQAHGDVRLDDQDHPGTEICGNGIDDNCNGQIDENCITSVTICNQVWMSKNLDVSKYRNGEEIPQVTDAGAWGSLTTGAWCYYENNSANGTTYGKLYNWYAVNDSRGLAPAGWHVPSDAEWTTLTDCLGGEALAGGKIKSTGTYEAGTGLWADPNTAATNSSGFTGYPGGIRTGDVAIDFSGINRAGYWWASTEFDANRAWTRQTFSDGGYLQSCHEQIPPQPCFVKTQGMSVRCVRD